MDARTSHRQRAAVFGLCMLATAAGGAMDAWVWIDHGRVFANAQSGNVVLMSIALAQGDGIGAATHLPSLIAFLLGMFASRFAGLRLKRAGLNSRNWRFSAECALLALLALVADRWSDTAVTAGVGLIAGLHITSFSHIGGWSLNTGMTTGNLRSFVNASVKAVTGSREDRPHAVLMASMAGCFASGAVLGALLTPRLHGLTLLVVATLVAAGLSLGLLLPDPVPDWNELN